MVGAVVSAKYDDGRTGGWAQLGLQTRTRRARARACCSPSAWRSTVDNQRPVCGWHKKGGIQTQGRGGMWNTPTPNVQRDCDCGQSGRSDAGLRPTGLSTRAFRLAFSSLLFFIAIAITRDTACANAQCNTEQRSPLLASGLLFVD